MTLITIMNNKTYRQRNPKQSDYYRCVETHFEELEMVWHEKYKKRFGFFRPYVRDVMMKYLNCGDPHMGFARIRCSDCGHEKILPLVCYS